MESKSHSFFSPPVSAVNHDAASGRHKWRAGEAMRRIPWSFIYSRKRRRRSRSLINNDPPRHPWAGATVINYCLTIKKKAEKNEQLIKCTKCRGALSPLFPAVISRASARTLGPFQLGRGLRRELRACCQQ